LDKNDAVVSQIEEEKEPMSSNMLPQPQLETKILAQNLS
jgi:hypothetical protein